MDGQALLGSFRSHDENCSDRIQYDSESSGLARDQKIKRDAPSLAARILDSSYFSDPINLPHASGGEPNSGFGFGGDGASSPREWG